MSAPFALFCQDARLLLPTLFLPVGTISVGRSSRCDIVLKLEHVSRHHAELVVRQESVRIRDLQSRNGTYIDGVKVIDSLVTAGQHIRFGAVPFQLAAVPADRHSDSEIDTAVCNKPVVLTDVDKLSEKQQGVLRLVLEGLSEKRIALRLGVSRFTVHNHIQAIYKLLNVHSRGELLACFLKHASDPAPISDA